jgi:hypothetical protein
MAQRNTDQRDSSAGASTVETVKQVAGDALDRAADVGRTAASQARRLAADSASTMKDQVKELLDRQLSSGVGVAGHLAGSIRLAADDLEQESPLVAGLVRSLGDSVDDYAKEFQDQTVEQVLQTAASFTRRRPALVFGLSALAGFFVYRAVKSRSDAPSIVPEVPTGQARPGGGSASGATTGSGSGSR